MRCVARSRGAVLENGAAAGRVIEARGKKKEPRCRGSSNIDKGALAEASFRLGNRLTWHASFSSDRGHHPTFRCILIFAWAHAAPCQRRICGLANQDG